MTYDLAFWRTKNSVFEAPSKFFERIQNNIYEGGEVVPELEILPTSKIFERLKDVFPGVYKAENTWNFSSDFEEHIEDYPEIIAEYGTVPQALWTEKAGGFTCYVSDTCLTFAFSYGANILMANVSTLLEQFQCPAYNLQTGVRLMPKHPLSGAHFCLEITSKQLSENDDSAWAEMFVPGDFSNYQNAHEAHAQLLEEVRELFPKIRMLDWNFHDDDLEANKSKCYALHDRVVLCIPKIVIEQKVPLVIERARHLGYDVFDPQLAQIHRREGIPGLFMDLEGYPEQLAPSLSQIVIGAARVNTKFPPGFMILNREDGSYAQCAGGEGQFTFEYRRELPDKSFKHQVAGFASEQDANFVELPTRSGFIKVKAAECLTLSEVQILFKAFSLNIDFPESFQWRDITNSLK